MAMPERFGATAKAGRPELPRSHGSVSVLVVDDSAFMRHVLTRELTSDPRIKVVGAARDGQEAISMARDLRPDVVTLDIEMPRLDGLGALPRILEVCPARVIMVSSNEGVGQTNTVRALELGAVDFILKPSGAVTPNMSSIRDTLLAAVHGAAVARVRRLATPTPSATTPRASTPPRPAEGGISARRLLIIGSSTGGPQALAAVVPHLPANLDAGVIIVQHMPPGFTTSLAARLNDLSQLSVREAADRDLVQNGVALLAPGDFHMRLVAESSGFRVRLDQGPRLHGVRPAVDITLTSATEATPGNVSCVILTGMGRDGTAGATTVRENGGWVIAQDEATCVIYGMPRSVVEAGAASEVVPLQDIAAAITARLTRPAAMRPPASPFLKRTQP